MIRINQLKLPVGHTEAEFRKKAAKMMRVPLSCIVSLTPVRQSLDARKKPDLYYIYTVDAVVTGRETEIIKRARNMNVMIHKETEYHFPERGKEALHHRPVIAGFGPAGMFCGLMLARAGYGPLILERGEDVDERTKRVRAFWEGGPLAPESNVQFGEGGAGTFSDGKLNTLVRDPGGRDRKILETLAWAGADPAILYMSRPHVGTDVLRGAVKQIREEILRLGGEIRFGSRLEDIHEEAGRLVSVEIRARGAAECERIRTDALILAIGHSARDTFAMLAGKDLDMQPKAFAVGLRIQHPQSQINLSQYGREAVDGLGAANYKLTWTVLSGRGVYSFCMCPGGFVVNASSEPGRVAVNGMSNHDRAGENANSALIVTVTPKDFPDQTALGGVRFQQRLEEAAFRCGAGKIPVQLYGDFRTGRVSGAFGDVKPAILGGFSFGNLRETLPEEISGSLIEAVDYFGSVIQGFDREDAILAGVESRTSSPLRILRDRGMESKISGLYPCGEGAGYAGGIMSAAMDGMRAAEALASRYYPAYA